MSSTLTDSEFRSRISQKYDDTFTSLSMYQGVYTPVTIMHSVCGHTFECLPFSLFYKRVECPKCVPHQRKVLLKSLKDYFGSNYVLKHPGNYLGDNVQVKHLACNKTYWTTVRSFEQKYECPKCEQNSQVISFVDQKRARDEADREIKEVCGNEYSIVKRQCGREPKLFIEHIGCGRTHWVKTKDFTTGYKCPKCERDKEMAHEQGRKVSILEAIRLRCGSEFSIVIATHNPNKKILLRHNTCGRSFWKVLRDFLNGKGCPKCHSKGKTHTMFEREFVQRFGSEYSLLSKYVNSTTRVKVRHNECGTIYDALPSTLSVGWGMCPVCRNSHGARQVEKYLRARGLSYVKEYKIDECRSISPLPFDFAVFMDDELVCLIEYDGEQHYRPSQKFGGIDQFLELQARDAIKDEYCLSHRIPLIRVSDRSYKKIESLLDRILAPISKAA